MVISHERCKNCNQRKGRSEQTLHCPARPMAGHDWEILSGNGISWDESLIGKLWAKKYGKVILLAIIVYVLFFRD